MALPEPPPDPHGVLAWANAIFDTLKAAYAALIVPSAVGIAWFVRRLDTRRDDARKREDAKRESEEAAHQRIADQLDRESAERFEMMRNENASLRLDNDRLRGLVRRWFDHAHDMRHEAGRLLQVTFGIIERGGLQAPKIEMPPLSYDIDAP